MTIVPTGEVVTCCELHRPGFTEPDIVFGRIGLVTALCCDPNDCGPCCPDCPTCPTLRRNRQASKAKP